MLPWNFLISINAFWNYKFRQVDNDTTEINQTTLAFMENSVSTSIWIILRNLTLSAGNCQEWYLVHQVHTTKTESTNLQISLFTFLQLLKKIHDKKSEFVVSGLIVVIWKKYGGPWGHGHKLRQLCSIFNPNMLVTFSDKKRNFKYGFKYWPPQHFYPLFRLSNQLICRFLSLLT